MKEDYDGFGASILNLVAPLDCFVHEHGAWRWAKAVPRQVGIYGQTVQVRTALPTEDMERLRDVLSRALEVVERQMA